MQIGFSVVQEVHAQLEVEQNWAIYGDNGFAWWPGELKQTIWAEESYEEDGCEFARVHCRTDFLTGFSQTDDQLEFVRKCMDQATTSGVVVHAGDPSKLQLAAAVQVHSENTMWTPRFLTLIAIMQAYEALRLISDLAALAGMAPDTSAHPDGGPRTKVDDVIMNATGLFRESGSHECPFQGQEMLELGEFVQQPFTVFSIAYESKLNAEIPFCGRTSLIVQDAISGNPVYGNGLLSTLQTPYSDEKPIRVALTWNTLELIHPTRNHFVGSWRPERGDSLMFRSFYPNYFCVRGLLVNLHYTLVARGRWLAESIFNDDWENDGYEKAVNYFDMKAKQFQDEVGSGKYLKERSLFNIANDVAPRYTPEQS